MGSNVEFVIILFRTESIVDSGEQFGKVDHVLFCEQGFHVAPSVVEDRGVKAKLCELFSDTCPRGFCDHKVRVYAQSWCWAYVDIEIDRSYSFILEFVQHSSLQSPL